MTTSPAIRELLAERRKLQQHLVNAMLGAPGYVPGRRFRTSDHPSCPYVVKVFRDRIARVETRIRLLGGGLLLDREEKDSSFFAFTCTALFAAMLAVLPHVLDKNDPYVAFKGLGLLVPVPVLVASGVTRLSSRFRSR